VVLAIGKPTLEALRALGVEPDLVSSEATVEACLEALAEYCVRKELCEQHAGDLS
jgi:uroporphyrinogen-III synthase